MALRGPYAKGIARRAALLDLALEVIARDGYSGATVKQIADAAGVSQNGLLHYFGSKDALFTEVLQRRDEVDQARGREEPPASRPADVVDEIAALVRRNSELPGFVQLYARLSNEAAELQHPSHHYFEDRYVRVRLAGRRILEQLRDDGRLAAEADIDRLAVLLFALIDGLQTQWLYDPSIDMPGQVRYFFESVLVGPPIAAGEQPHDAT